MQLTDRIPMPAWGEGATVSVADALGAAAEMLMAPTEGGAVRLDVLLGQVADRQQRIEAKLDRLLGDDGLRDTMGV